MLSACSACVSTQRLYLQYRASLLLYSIFFLSTAASRSRVSLLSNGIDYDSSESFTDGLVCQSPGHAPTPVKNPIVQFQSRSVWFQRRAIIITAIFLAIFIVLIIGLTVFMRDRAPPVEDDLAKSEAHNRINDALLTPKTPKTTTRKTLRRRRIRGSRRNTRSIAMPGRSFSQQTSTRDVEPEPASETNEESCDVPPLVMVRVTPRGTILSEEVLEPSGSAETSAPSNPTSESRSLSPRQDFIVPEHPTPSSLQFNEANAEVSHQLPVGYEATQPPSYLAISRPSQSDYQEEHAYAGDDAPSGSSAHSPSSAILRPLSVSNPDTHSWAAHVATDEKSTLHALHGKRSAPNVPSPLSPIPSAPPRPSLSDDAEHRGISDVFAMTQGPLSDTDPSIATTGTFPAPPTMFEPSVGDTSDFLTYSSVGSSKAHEAAQQSSWLSTLLPSRPGLSEPAYQSYFSPDMALPMYGSDPTIPDLDLELGLAPSAPPLPADAIGDEHLIPSAPDLDPDAGFRRSSTHV